MQFLPAILAVSIELAHGKLRLQHLLVQANVVAMKKIVKMLPFLIMFGFVSWIVFLADTGAQSAFFDFTARLPWGDKIGHFCLIGFLAFTANLALGFRFIRSFGRWAQWGSISVFLLAMVEEFSQLYFANRGFDWVDMAFDALGILFFTTVSVFLMKRQIQQKPEQSGRK